MDSSPTVLFTWWSKEKPPWSLCCSDGVGGRDEKVSGILEHPRVYFSRQTAQVILIPHWSILSLGGPQPPLKTVPLKRAALPTVLSTSLTLMKLLSSRMSVYLYKNKKKYKCFKSNSTCSMSTHRHSRSGRTPERRGACMSVVWQTQTRCFNYVLPGVWLSGRTKQFL